MRSLTWLLITFAVVLGGIWLTTRRGGTVPAVPVAVASEPPAEDRTAESPAATSPPPAEVVASAAAVVDRFVEVRGKVDAAFGVSAALERAALDEAVALGVGELGEGQGEGPGDDRAFELVIATLSHPGSKLHGTPAVRDTLLRRARGSRAVQRFAAETIESSTANSDGFERAEVQSIQVLLATNGLRTGLLTLLEQLSASDPKLVKGAAEALKSARPVDAGLRAELREWLFAEFLTPHACSVRPELVQALLELDRPSGVRDETHLAAGESRLRLLAIAFAGAEVGEIEVPPEVDGTALAREIRGAALFALVHGFDAETLARSIAFYDDRSLPDDPDVALRDQVPGMWRRLLPLEPEATPERREEYRALLRPLEQYFLEQLESQEPRRVDDVRSALRGAAFQPLDPLLAAALAKIDRD